MKKLLTLVVILTFASCSSLKVYTDKDPEVDFTKYSTYEYYGWAENSDQLMSELDKNRIESAFNAEFAKRGLSYVSEKGSGDAVISLFIVTEDKQSTTAYTTHMGMGGYGGRWGYGYGGMGMNMGTSNTTYNTTDYTQGTLVVSMYDAQTKKLVWQATATGVIEENPEKRAKNIPNGVAKVMAKYPIAAQ
jgi:hypothetical protein